LVKKLVAELVYPVTDRSLSQIEWLKMQE